MFTMSLTGPCGSVDYKKIQMDQLRASIVTHDTVWCHRFQSQIIAKTLLCTLTVKVMERFQFRFYKHI